MRSWPVALVGDLQAVTRTMLLRAFARLGGLVKGVQAQPLRALAPLQGCRESIAKLVKRGNAPHRSRTAVRLTTSRQVRAANGSRGEARRQGRWGSAPCRPLPAWGADDERRTYAGMLARRPGGGARPTLGPGVRPPASHRQRLRHLRTADRHPPSDRRELRHAYQSRRRIHHSCPEVRPGFFINIVNDHAGFNGQVILHLTARRVFSSVAPTTSCQRR